MDASLRDPETQRALTALANATAEVVGRGPVYQAILKVTAVRTGASYTAACRVFDAQDRELRIRIRDTAINSLRGQTASDGSGRDGTARTWGG